MNFFDATKSFVVKEALDLLIQNNFFELDEKAKSNAEIVLVRTYDRIDQVFLDQFPKLKYLLVCAVGTNNVDFELCKNRGVEVINAPGSNSNAVAEYCVAMMIVHLRNCWSHITNLKSGKWDEEHIARGAEIKNKTVGLIGFGAIGKLIAKKMANFECRDILVYDTNPADNQSEFAHIKNVDLDTLLSTSDIISIQVPLTEETFHMIAKPQFETMQKKPLIVNIGRGGLVDEQALLEAFDANQVSGAILDVFENEPNVNPKIYSHSKILTTPHIGADTAEAQRAMCMTPVERLVEIMKL